MGKKIKKLISENPEISSMRIALLIITITACTCALGLGIWAIFLGRDLFGVAAIVSALLVPALGGKAWQKKYEPKPTVKKDDIPEIPENVKNL